MFSNRIRAHGREILAFEQAPELYAPLADWREPKQYPPVIPKENAGRAFRHRVAWELLRRTPRYRHNFARLQAKGHLAGRTFPDGARFYSFEKLPGPKARSLGLDGHACFPAALDGETLGEFMQRNAGEAWWVQHGHDWACEHWCLRQLLDPARPFESRPDPIFCWEPRVFGLDRTDYEPKEYEISLVHTTVAVQLRLDASIPAQLEEVQKKLEAYQDEYRALQETRGVRLMEPELAHYWLRSWDAYEAQRANTTEASPRFDTYRVQVELYKGLAALQEAWGDLDAPERRSLALVETLKKDLSKESSVKRWWELLRGYLIERDTAYRELLFVNSKQ